MRMAALTFSRFRARNCRELPDFLLGNADVPYAGGRTSLNQTERSTAFSMRKRSVSSLKSNGSKRSRFSRLE
jgi:hypothetical protein